MSRKKVSIVFRALNEEKWLGEALKACLAQKLNPDTEIELILVDSGSTDNTIAIAQKHGCQVFHISKSEFTFGRSLNIGCDGATGDYLVFISAHCIPCSDTWLERLIAPLKAGQCDYTYGGQVGMPGVTHFSEAQVFAHYYGQESDLSQQGFFCNNANAAATRKAWAAHRFDENVTGLEDMVLAKAIVGAGGQIGYVADAAVTHIHEESLQQTHRRYFREALVMRDIMPEVHFNLFDFMRCLTAGITNDLIEAARLKQFRKHALDIIAYRFMQYWGTYRGHNNHRELSRAQKEQYYYPRRVRQRSESPHRPARKDEAQKIHAEAKSSH